MNIDKLTKLPNVDLGNILNPDRPILPYWKNVNNAMCSEPHSHSRGQLIYSAKGITRVKTKNKISLIPTSQALWCPPNIVHELIFPHSVSIANLFIDAEWVGYMPTEVKTLNVTPLVKELILRAVNIGENYSKEGPNYRLMVVLIDEISRLNTSELTLPWSNHRTLKPVMTQLFENPTSTENIEYWASCCSTTTRTLSRLFKSEVNMGFSQWRMQVRLFYALERLSQGESVTSISLDLGYSQSSSFIAAFRKILGKTPMEY